MTRQAEQPLWRRELNARIHDALERANPCYVVIHRIWLDGRRELSACSIRRVLLEEGHEWTPAERTLRRYLRDVERIRNEAINNFRAP